MRPFEWYNLNVYHLMESWWKTSFSKKTQKQQILVALDTYAKKMNPPSIVLGGGGAW